MPRIRGRSPHFPFSLPSAIWGNLNHSGDLPSAPPSSAEPQSGSPSIRRSHSSLPNGSPSVVASRIRCIIAASANPISSAYFQLSGVYRRCHRTEFRKCACALIGLSADFARHKPLPPRNVLHPSEPIDNEPETGAPCAAAARGSPAHSPRGAGGIAAPGPPHPVGPESGGHGWA